MLRFFYCLQVFIPRNVRTGLLKYFVEIGICILVGCQIDFHAFDEILAQ